MQRIAAILLFYKPMFVWSFRRYLGHHDFQSTYFFSDYHQAVLDVFCMVFGQRDQSYENS